MNVELMNRGVATGSYLSSTDILRWKSNWLYNTAARLHTQLMTWGWKWQISAPELLIVTSSRRSEHARTSSSILWFIGQFQSGTVSPPRWRRPAHLISSRAGWSRCAHNSSGTLALWALLSAGFWLELLSCHDYKQRNFVNSVDNVMKLSRFVNLLNWLLVCKILCYTSL